MQQRIWLGNMLLVLCLLASRTSYAEMCQGQPGTLTVTGSETVTVGAAAVGFTANKITNAAQATFYVYTAAVAYTIAGDTPSTTVGYQSPVGTTQDICGLAQIKLFRAIRTTGVDSTLYVTYWQSR